MIMNKKLRIIIGYLIILTVFIQSALTVKAMTVYESDEICHDEGYIFVGESHSVLAAHAVGDKAQEYGNVLPWGDGNGISYVYNWDSSREVTQDGAPNTFTMKGNLFFIFEGNKNTDASTQISKEYIYSDGKGGQGRAVQKIHEIMNVNPNIAHWNIISLHGAVSASKGSKEIADYYVNSYRNWITYEFPQADIYFLSVATMTKYYRSTGDKKVFNATLATAFPDRFLDYTDFYTSRSRTRMIDTIHWDAATYVDLIEDVINKIQQHKETTDQADKKEDSSLAYAVTEAEAVFYTNDMTVIYAEPSLESTVILPSCETGLPVQVTGVTDNGFFRVKISSEGMYYYIPGYGLTP